MTRHILIAVAVTLAAGGVSYPQTPAREASSKESAPAGSSASAPENGRQPLSKSLEKTKEKVGDALDKTSTAVKETLGFAKRGCLKRGDEADPFLLDESADKTGDEITVVGSADLANYVGRMVRVYGEKEGDGRVFHVTKIEQLAPSCDALPLDEATTAAGANHGLNAGDQGTSAADRELTRAIRQGLVEDKALSIYAQNIKIISRGGFVTLKGLVRSEQEKQSVEAKAIAAAGGGNVSNELEVRTASSHP
jgi:osmotically-inducible protein OsmY